LEEGNPLVAEWGCGGLRTWRMSQIEGGCA